MCLCEWVFFHFPFHRTHFLHSTFNGFFCVFFLILIVFYLFFATIFFCIRNLVFSLKNIWFILNWSCWTISVRTCHYSDTDECRRKFFWSCSPVHTRKSNWGKNGARIYFRPKSLMSGQIHIAFSKYQSNELDQIVFCSLALPVLKACHLQYLTDISSKIHCIDFHLSAHISFLKRSG